jgi:hypothetical protein
MGKKMDAVYKDKICNRTCRSPEYEGNSSFQMRDTPAEKGCFLLTSFSVIFLKFQLGLWILFQVFNFPK